MYPIAARIAAAYLLPKITRKVMNWAFTGSINQIEPGSVVLCTLLEHAKHSGIYVGGGKIVHFDGSGVVEKVTPEVFVRRLKIFNKVSVNTAVDIYVPASGDGADRNPEAVERAEAAVGPRTYHVLRNNCHRFTYYCLTGDDSPRTFRTERDIFRASSDSVVPAPSMEKWNWKMQDPAMEATSRTAMESDA